MIFVEELLQLHWKNPFPLQLHLEHTISSGRASECLFREAEEVRWPLKDFLFSQRTGLVTALIKPSEGFIYLSKMARLFQLLYMVFPLLEMKFPLFFKPASPENAFWKMHSCTCFTHTHTHTLLLLSSQFSEVQNDLNTNEKEIQLNYNRKIFILQYILLFSRKEGCMFFPTHEPPW